MNTKGANLLEQHVEKIVLGVAAAGALYLGYLAIQPVNIAPGSTVAVDKVEDTLAGLISGLKASEDANTKMGPIKSSLPDYRALYDDLIRNQPLSSALVSTQIPTIGPLNLPVRPGDSQVIPTAAVVTPTPVPPESITAEAWQQPVAAVALPTPGNNGVPAPGTALPMRDQNAVVIQGEIPIGIMQAEMASQSGMARLPDNLQRASVYRIEVQRRVLSAAGWSNWADMPAAKGSAPPTTVDWNAVTDPQPEMDLADGEFKQIVVPNFYLDAQGNPIPPPLFTKPTPKAVIERNNKLQEDLNKAKKITVAPQPAAVPGTPPAPAPGSPAAAAAAAPPPVSDPAILRTQPLIPFAFWDENVESNHQYQYQVRVVYVNPTFNWQFGLKNPKMKTQPTLASEWVVTSDVLVNADVEFFVTGATAKPNGQTADVRIYKRTAGKWYRSQWDIDVGTEMTGPVPLVDQKPEIKLDVDTGYTVIDVVGSGNDARAILMDPSGNLVTRIFSEDHNSPENAKLFSISVTRQPTTVAPPAAPQGTPRGAQPPPPRGRNPVLPPNTPQAPDAGGGFNG